MLAAVVLLGTTACSSVGASDAASARPPAPADATPAGGATTVLDATSGPPGSATVAGTDPSVPAVTVPPFTATTVAPPAPVRVSVPARPCPTPPRHAADLEPADLQPELDALRRAGGQVSVSVSVGGVETVAVNADQALVPASNQKLLVAAAALELLGPEATLTTRVVATGPVVAGVVQGDLILVGGGDPTLTTIGPTASLEQLAAQLQARGITGVQGRLVVDERRYDTRRSEPGWPGSVWPSAVGSLSAVVVDRNRVIDDPAVLTDPALVHGRRFRATLAAAGITAPEPVTAEGDAGTTSASGGTTPGGAASAAFAGEQVAAIESAPLRELVEQMLARSDNLIAEELTKELGVRGRGRGTTVDGLAVARATAAGLCLGLDGTDADGSGLSAGTTRSAAAWRRLLEAAPRRPWGAVLRAGLPVAGRSGTLASRLLGGATAGRVQAKTGSIGVSRALSGYTTTVSGQPVVFSIIVNAPTTATEPAVDSFVTALVTRG